MSEQWDGRPQNPERDGWHWLHSPEPKPVEWSAASQTWWLNEPISPARMSASNYLGPCLTPDEIAAREAASAEAMRRECARRFEAMRAEQEAARARHGAMGSDARDKFEAWLDGDDTSALARALAAAEKRGMMKALADVLLDVQAIAAHIPHLKARDYPDDMGRLIEDIKTAIRERNAAAQESEQ